MSTIAQINANTANAQHSTGPRTHDGKAVSSRNALKFGIFAQADILPGEDPAAFEQLLAAYADELQPAGIIESQLVYDIVRGIWLDLRYTRIEREIIEMRVAELPAGQQNNAVARVYSQDGQGSKVLDKLDRRRNAARRQLAAAKKELACLQAARRVPEPDLVTDAPAKSRNRVRFVAPLPDPEPPTEPASKMSSDSTPRRL